MKKPKITEGYWVSSVSVDPNHEPYFITSLSRLDDGKGAIICRISNEVSKKPLNDEDRANSIAIAALPDLIYALLQAQSLIRSRHQDAAGGFVESIITEALLKAGCTE